jgi:hypothetical protein
MAGLMGNHHYSLLQIQRMSQVLVNLVMLIVIKVIYVISLDVTWLHDALDLFGQASKAEMSDSDPSSQQMVKVSACFATSLPRWSSACPEQPRSAAAIWPYGNVVWQEFDVIYLQQIL